MQETAAPVTHLKVIWVLFFSLVMSAPLLGVVLLLSMSGRPDATDPLFYAVAIAGLGVLSLALVAWARSRPLATSSKEALVTSFRTNLILSFACAEPPVLLGFVGALLTHELWLYGLGLAFLVMAVARIAPTRTNLERRQQQLMAQGSPLMLLDALNEDAVTSSSGVP